MDPATRRLALIASGLGGTLLAVIGGWTVYSHRASTVPVIQADNGPVRVKPDNPGGMQIAGANEDILSGISGSGSSKLAPPPESPAPQALSTPPPAATPTPPAVVQPPAPVAVAAPAAVAPSQAVDKPVVSPERRIAVVAPERANPGAKNTLVQLAAVRSEAAAKSEWQRLERQMPTLLGQHRPAFSKIDRNGQTLWRVRTGGFNDVADANAFCERVRAKGAGCSVADF
jgi:hypothetical protein